MHREPCMCSAGLAGWKTWHSHFKPQRECRKEMVSEKWYTSWEAVWCYRRGREFTSLLSRTGHFTSPLSFLQLKNEGIEVNSGLSVLTCCILWWPGLKSGFFLLALGAAIRSPALTRSTPNLSSLSSGLFCTFLPQFPSSGSPVRLPASR